METLASGFALVEGPRPDGRGGAYFSDATGGGVHHVDASGAVATVVEKRRGVGGIVAHADGGLVVTGRDVAHGDRVVLARPEGVTGFNDLTTDALGRVFVGALRYHPLKGEDPVPGEVWRIDGDGSAEPVLEGIEWPNGMAFSPDGRTLYVADYGNARVLASRDGAALEEWARSPRGEADGLAVDADGEVWVALGSGKGIAHFTSDGDLVDVLDVPAEFVASLEFDGDRLLIATWGALLATRAPAAGLPVTPARV